MKLMLLDRDGVINQDSPNYVKTPEEWLPIKGSLEAIAKLYKAGWHIFVVSNQSVIGRGLATVDGVAKIHAKMQRLLGLHGRTDRRIVLLSASPRRSMPLPQT